MNYKLMVILQSFHKINKKRNSNTTCWEWWMFQNRKSKNLKIPNIGSDIFHFRVVLTWTDLEFMLIIQDHSLPLTWTRIIIHLFNGNLSNWKKKGTLILVKDLLFTHPKISKCAPIMTGQKVRVLDQKNILWLRSKFWNWMKLWKKQVWKAEKYF